jgi:hypothetical protein
MHGANSWPRATIEARHREVEAAAADRVVPPCGPASSRVAELRAGGTREAAVSSARGATRGTTRACATRERTTSCTQGFHTRARAEQARTGAHEVGWVEKSCVRDEMSTRGASADHRQHELATSTTRAGGGESPSAQIGSAWLHRHRVAGGRRRFARTTKTWFRGVLPSWRRSCYQGVFEEAATTWVAGRGLGRERVSGMDHAEPASAPCTCPIGQGRARNLRTL